MTTGESSTTYQQGEVVLVDFPFTDLSTRKTRPAVVVSTDEYNNERPDIILGALTSRVQKARGIFHVILKDWQSANLQRPSAFRPVLFTFEKSQILYKVGKLSHTDWQAVEEKLLTIFQAIQAANESGEDNESTVVDGSDSI